MSSNERKPCKHCKKIVVSPLDCSFCETSFHPSGAYQAKTVYKLNNQEEIVCCCRAMMDEKRIRTIFRDLLTEC